MKKEKMTHWEIIQSVTGDAAVEFWRMKKVMAITGLAKSTLYKMIAEGNFPAPVKLSERSSAFISTEVMGWLNSRVAERNESLANA